MTVLIVEDDDPKMANLAQIVKEQLSHAEVKAARSYREGLRSILSSPPDLVILDMNMPTYDLTSGETGGRPKLFAGREIIREMRRKRLHCKAVVVTQFEKFGEGAESLSLEELRLELESAYPAQYIGAIYYHPSQSNWRDELVKILNRFRTR